MTILDPATYSLKLPARRPPPAPVRFLGVLGVVAAFAAFLTLMELLFSRPPRGPLERLLLAGFLLFARFHEPVGAAAGPHCERPRPVV